MLIPLFANLETLCKTSLSEYIFFISIYINKGYFSLMKNIDLALDPNQLQ